jgi:endonuclease/exonuclease/phosphatase family metal-dependent hydrolase
LFSALPCRDRASRSNASVINFPRRALGVVCCTILTGTCAIFASAAGDAIPLRIVTFNSEYLSAPGVTPGEIQNYRFDHGRRQHLERVAHLIETLAPDIFNLVEVTSKEAVEQVVKILHEKGLADYQGYHVDSNDTYTALDVAVITRHPPDDVDGHKIRTYFSGGDDPTWRESFQFRGRNGRMIRDTTSLSRNSVYFVTVAGHKLGFLGLHLKANPQDDYSNAKRTGEAVLAGRVLRGEIVKRGYLPIVLGDLNDYDADVPDRDESRDTSTTVLRDLKDFDRSRPGAELVNIAEKIVRQADRYTSHWDWNENRAHDGEDVYTMIDHILLAKELMPHVTRAFICHSVSLDTSDHYAVVVDLRLPSGKSEPEVQTAAAADN